jgi:hypothetical protein
VEPVTLFAGYSHCIQCDAVTACARGQCRAQQCAAAAPTDALRSLLLWRWLTLVRWATASLSFDGAMTYVHKRCEARDVRRRRVRRKRIDVKQRKFEADLYALHDLHGQVGAAPRYSKAHSTAYSKETVMARSA